MYAGTLRAYVGRTEHPHKRCTPARLRNDPPRRLREHVERHGISHADIKFHVLDVFKKVYGDDAEARWTSAAQAGYPEGLNGFETYGDPTQSRTKYALNRYGRSRG